jgi:hypothetical protein
MIIMAGSKSTILLFYMFPNFQESFILKFGTALLRPACSGRLVGFDIMNPNYDHTGIWVFGVFSALE